MTRSGNVKGPMRLAGRLGAAHAAQMMSQGAKAMRGHTGLAGRLGAAHAAHIVSQGAKKGAAFRWRTPKGAEAVDVTSVRRGTGGSRRQ